MDKQLCLGQCEKGRVKVNKQGGLVLMADCAFCGEYETETGTTVGPDSARQPEAGSRKDTEKE